MPRRPLIPLLALAALALAACGSSTHVVNVPDTAANSVTPPTTTTTSAVRTTTARTVTGTVRTATAPAFASSTQSAGGPQAAAVAAVQDHGCHAVDPGQYHTDQTLAVLVGGCGSGQQAFFFVDGRYIGTDTKAPSAHIAVVSQSDTAVTLSYALSHPDGSSAGTAQVQFALNNGALQPMGAIPDASPSAPVSRR